MTFSAKARIRTMEAELKLYWDAMRRSRQIVRKVGLKADTLEECHGELEAIATYTAWPTLRRFCTLTITQDKTRMNGRRVA